MARAALTFGLNVNPVQRGKGIFHFGRRGVDGDRGDTVPFSKASGKEKRD